MPIVQFEEILCVFNEAGCLLLEDGSGGWRLPGMGDGARYSRWFPDGGAPVLIGELPGGRRVFFAQVEQAAPRLESGDEALVQWFTLEELASRVGESGFSAPGELVQFIRRHALRIPYLNFRDSDFIYRFRTEKQRNTAAYRGDPESRDLYQSALCEAIKRLRRTRERSADRPALLDFGAVRYVLPSHFGFCLGVQNAIERAYETLADNPGRRVFMLSELIHNPFVNEDLFRRGLRYLQTDKGEPIRNPETGRSWWDELTQEDIVVIPAFGATDEDKIRLIERGIALNRYDATCMLVEKVWKAARRFGGHGYTVIIHGKSEHEETKATFSNSAKAGPSLVVRDLQEARLLTEVIRAPDRAEKERRFQAFAGRHTVGFDVETDLNRVAIVNQTTLLRNETLKIIDLLEKAYAELDGPDSVREHLYSGSRSDTLCYATQVNQDALERALALDLEAALVVGGRNSSNTFQLYRMCADRCGDRAFYIQSEENILDRGRISHYIFPAHPGASRHGSLEERTFLPADLSGRPLLITGGASCPDGLIQQVIAKINGFFPRESLRSMDKVLADLEPSD